MGKRKQMDPKDTVEEQKSQEEEPEAGSSDFSGSDDDSGSADDSGSDSEPEVSDDDEDSPDDEDFDQINVNFEFFDAKESDFHGLKALLHSYLDGQQYDSSLLIDTIIAQSAVGTVVRTGEDEDPIGVMTVLNTHQHKQQPFMQQIRQYMVDKCREAAAKDAIIKAWDSPTTGLVINERLLNSPPQLAPPLVQALFDEISWATEDLPKQEDRQAFQFQHYLLMTRVYADPLPQQQQQQDGAGPSSSKPPAGPSAQRQRQQQQQQPKKQKNEAAAAAAAAAAGPVIVYVRPEDEFFHKQASVAFTFPVEGRAVGKDELQPLRLVLLLPASKVPAARGSLDAVVGNLAAAQQ